MKLLERARISPQKRLDELIAAFRIALTDLPVEWFGETQDIAAFHTNCDVFTMTSDYLALIQP
jgi:hypothetical protein